MPLGSRRTPAGNVTAETPPTAGLPGPLRVEDAFGLEHLEHLRPDWQRLWERCPWATPFQHPDWLIPWCGPFGVREPWLVLLWSQARLVGLIPLVIYSRGEERVVTLLGSGISDYQDALLDLAWAAEGAAALLQHLGRHTSRWDICEFEHLRPESPLSRAAPPEEWNERICEEEPCPVLRLPARVEQLQQVSSSRMLKNLRTSRRRAERLGSVRFESADAHNLPELLDCLTHLHRSRWALRDQPGVLPEHLAEFHRQVAGRLLAGGLLRLYALRVQERVAAVYYGFLAGGRAYYYLGGFDPEFQKLSPGSLLVQHAIQQAIQEGAAEFDFLRGREKYKYDWGAEDRPTHTRALWIPGSGRRPPLPLGEGGG